jgi:hypothetical protein
VPDDSLAAVGEREEKFSLNTRDPAEAKRLLAAALVVLELRWRNSRAGAQARQFRTSTSVAGDLSALTTAKISFRRCAAAMEVIQNLPSKAMTQLTRSCDCFSG